MLETQKLDTGLNKEYGNKKASRLLAINLFQLVVKGVGHFLMGYIP